ncbi:hypothetical protein PIB30_112365, partial [Stylosanthes scabra]|nr:hypothetical protein [Stylosanthes scabra]
MSEGESGREGSRVKHSEEIGNADRRNKGESEGGFVSGGKEGLAGGGTKSTGNQCFK